MLVLTRRASAVATAVVLCVGVAGCGSGDGEEVPSGRTAGDVGVSAALEEAKAEIDRLNANPPLVLEPLSATPEEGYKVASVTCTISTCYPGTFEKAAEALGWVASEETYDIMKGPSAFVAAVRRALQTKPQALAILGPVPPEVIEDEVKQAQDQGVVLVLVGSAVDDPTPGFIACIICNPAYARYGKDMATWVAVDDARANAGVGIVGDKTNESHIGSGRASVDEIARLMPDAEVTQINVSFAQTPQANAQTVISALQRDPGIKYLIYQTPDLLAGVDQALSAAGLADQVRVVAPGPATADALQSVKQGFPTAWVTIDGPAYWYRVADAMARNLLGDEFDPAPAVSTRLVTKDNVTPELLTPPNYEAAFEQAWGVGN